MIRRLSGLRHSGADLVTAGAQWRAGRTTAEGTPHASPSRRHSRRPAVPPDRAQCLLEGPRTRPRLAEAFLEGLTADQPGRRRAGGPGRGHADARPTWCEQIKVLTGDLLPSQAAMSLVGDPQVNENDAEAKVDVDWQVADGVQWKYETTVRLRKRDESWRVVWTPATVHRDLKAGRRPRAARDPAASGVRSSTAPARPIVTARPVVIVGIEPQRITNQAAAPDRRPRRRVQGRRRRRWTWPTCRPGSRRPIRTPSSTS